MKAYETSLFNMYTFNFEGERRLEERRKERELNHVPTVGECIRRLEQRDLHPLTRQQQQRG
jgi:hypothetical protein